MKILHVVPTYIPAWRYGGPILSVHGLCKGLAALGHQVDVLTTSIDGPDDSDVPIGTPVTLDGVRIWYYRAPLLRRLAWSPGLSRAVRERCRDYELVHVHSLFLWPTLAASRAAIRNHVPYVLCPRGMLVKELVRRKSRWLKTAWIRLFDRTHLERAAALHLTSTAEQDEVLRFGYRLPETFVIPNGIDPEPVDAPDGGTSADTSNVLFLGRINWEKGIERLIRALPYAPAARVTLAGNYERNYRAELESLAEEVGVAQRITFAGWVEGPEKRALLRRAALLVLPSYSENFGNVVLEAIAAGCPALVTEGVGAADVVRETGAGRVTSGEPRELGNALAELLAEPERLREMGRVGSRIAIERFSWQAIARRMEGEYRRLLGPPAPDG